MKQDDCVSEGGKQQNTSSFLFSTNKFLSFFVSKMNAKKTFVEKLQQQCKEKYKIQKKKSK
jgi:hypothetical protein